MKTLFTPQELGRYVLKNRLVMAPMTRSRADDGTGVPSELAASYYGERANAGLIITEGTYPEPLGKGYVRTPGIHSAKQIEAWRRVTDAVHAQDGRIFLQLMHTGRISHPSLLPDGQLPVAPSAVKPKGTVYTATGPQDMVTPRALATDEVASVIRQYAQATRHALEAGFDGVELHAASGYLPEQFLSSSTNLRTDDYGGSLARRTRFIVETLTAMIEVAGPDRVGIKIAPEMNFNDIRDENPQETYAHLVRAIAPLNLAYLHVALQNGKHQYRSLLRPLFKGTFLQGGGLTRESGEALVGSGEVDAVVYGAQYLANPDLPARFKSDAPLNTPDRATFFSAGPAGYIDYPAMGSGS